MIKNNFVYNSFYICQFYSAFYNNIILFKIEITFTKIYVKILIITFKVLIIYYNLINLWC